MKLKESTKEPKHSIEVFVLVVHRKSRHSNLSNFEVQSENPVV